MSQNQYIVLYFFKGRKSQSIDKATNMKAKSFGLCHLRYFEDVGKFYIRLIFCLRMTYFWGLWESGNQASGNPPAASASTL